MATHPVKVTVRHEVRATEQRAPLVPADAARLVDRGFVVTVEESPQRAIEIAEYAAVGCATAEAGSWMTAPEDTCVLGLKELPDQPAGLAHRHLFFGHAYKGQLGADALLRRFIAGRGALLDLEYLVDDTGRRLTAFGYWAGYVGAALAVLHHSGGLTAPLRPMTKDTLDDALRRAYRAKRPTALVIGALGRCGRGARDAFAAAGVRPTCWDLAETRTLDRAALLDHDILVNAVLTTRPTPPFLTRADLDGAARRLSVVADVTCDATSPWNLLPLYDTCTTWQRPVRRLDAAGVALDLIAIDNLPSLLPREASIAFSADLVPHLLTLGGTAPVWERCRQFFVQACATVDAGLETTNG
jgi:saccharopine dehydrogenase (NAD+, L-lysine-forming)